MTSLPNIDQMTPDQLRGFAAQLMSEVDTMGRKIHRAYVWDYCTRPFSALKAVVYDFSPSRAGEHARNFLRSWNGKLVCDDFAGYKAGFEKRVTEIGCMAHARRKFFDLHVANKSQPAAQALHSIGGLYEVERQACEMSDEDR